MSVPRGAMAGVITAYFLYIIVLFVGASLPPGVGALSNNKHPLAYALRLLFPSMSYTTSVGIGSIGAFATITPWLYAYSRQWFAMSRKGYVPSIFRNMWRGVPWVSVLFTALSGYFLVLLLLVLNDDFTNQVIIIIALLTTIWLYQLFTGVYILLKYKYPELERKYRSPFGLYGALAGFVTYTIMLVFYLMYDIYMVGISCIIFFALVIVWSMYFCAVSRKYLILDSDEKQAIISKLTTAMMMNSEHGFEYLEQHCLKEMNPESLYCLKVHFNEV